MNAAALDGAISTVGVAGIAGLLLPSINDAWNASPGDQKTRAKISTGERVYFLILATVGTLQSIKARSAFPLLFGLAVGLAVAYTYEHALRSQPEG